MNEKDEVKVKAEDSEKDEEKDEEKEVKIRMRGKKVLSCRQPRSEAILKDGLDGLEAKIQEISEDEDEEKASEVDEGEVRRMRKMVDPKLPSAAEIEAHEMTHLPFRNWCRHCVKGRSVERGHYRQEREEGALPEVHLDWAFPASEGGGKGIVVLAARERDTRMTCATVVPRKGTTGEFACRRMVAFIKEIGLEGVDIIIKSDQEEACKALVSDVAKWRGSAKTVVEHSPVKSSQSNGIVERAIRSVVAQMRVMKGSLEARWKVTIPDEHAIITWMTEYAAVLLNRYEVSRDGKTSYERMKGKKSQMHGMEFGEGIMFKRKPKDRSLAKLTSMWEDGVYLGIKALSGEVIVSTDKGVFKTRTATRKPLEERWDVKNAERIGGTPWRMSSEDEEMDGPEVKEEIKVDAERLNVEDREKVRAAPEVPRSFVIKQSDLEEHGYTAKCLGCKAILRRTARQAHNDECRSRLSKAMASSEKVQRAIKRENEFVAKVIEEQDAKKAKKEGKAAERIEKEVVEEEVIEKSEERQAGDRKMDREGAHQREREEEEGENIEGKTKKRRTEVVEGCSGSSSSAGIVLRDDEGDVMVGEVAVNVEPEDEELKIKAYDDLTGREMNAEDTRLGREEEIEYMQNRRIWDEKDEEDCWKDTGKPPVSVRWVDVQKGEEVRCRLVARDFKPKWEDDRADLFASMPPLEAKKALFSKAASQVGLSRKKKLLFIDAKKAHLNGKVDEGTNAYIQLPDEVGKPGKVGKLNFWLYGMRPAARGWENDYSKKFTKAGFIQGAAAPTTFYDPVRDLHCAVHGDDFTFLGFEEDLEWATSLMSTWYDVKVRGILGPDPDDLKEIVILGRTVTWKEWGIEIRADEKHAKRVIAYCGLEAGSKGVQVPGEKDKLEFDGEEGDEGEELAPKEATEFRGMAATMSYLGMDRMDVQFCAKELCRSMAKPTSNSVKKLKKAARYLVANPDVCIEYRDQVPQEVLSIFVDSDWAGCPRTRKSTSGGIICLGNHAVKSWSTTQSIIATSSAEAELYAVVEGAARGLGAQSVLEDLGISTRIKLVTDSSGGKSICNRQGIGKTRHVHTKFLWVQQAVYQKRLTVGKILGTENPSDVLTKYLSSQSMARVLHKVGVKFGKKGQLESKECQLRGGVRHHVYTQE